jgi:hypothetical protein
MKSKMRLCFTWLVALIVPGLLVAACTMPSVEPAPTPAAESAALPESDISLLPTPTPAPATTLVATPAPEPAAAQVSAPTQGPETPAGVLYTDDFTRPDSGWPGTTVFDNYYIGYHEPEYYHVEVRVPHDSEVVVLPEHSFDDFSAEAQVFPDQANTAPEGDFRYGLAVRRAGRQFYAFTISSRTQAWTVLKSSPASLEVLAQGSDDSIRGEAGEDTLRVDAQGSTFTFHINGRAVSQVSDADYSSGELGFYVETFDAPRVHIHYDSLTIRQVEGPQPGQADVVAEAATPAPTPSPLQCSVVTPMLNLRRGPGTFYTPPIAGLPSGTLLEPLGRSPDSLWLQVRVAASGEEGWVAAAAAYISCNVFVNELPVSQPPPTPTR